MVTSRIPLAHLFLCLLKISCALSLCHPTKKNGPLFPPSGAKASRRDVLLNTISVAAGGVLSLFSPSPQAFAETRVPSSPSSTLFGEGESAFKVYGVRPDSSAALSPSLTTLSPSKFRSVLAMTGARARSRGGALWLGEHHNSEADHRLQADFIRSIYEQRKEAFKLPPPPMAIGLEQVQKQFQPALDDFIAGKISIEEMRKQVQWDKRWVWPFEVYEQVFIVAKELRIPLIAFNVDSEDLGLVEKSGYPGLSREQLNKYIKDPIGFAEFTKPQSYRTYVDYVIRPSYDLHKDMGLLRTTITGQQLQEEMSFRNFFSGRILWDEAMASAAHEWTASNPGGLIVGLVGADHIKFSSGVPGRYMRMVGEARDSVSVILNPTLIDTRPSGSVSNVASAYSSLFPEELTLQLRYSKEGVDVSSMEMRSTQNTGGVLPFADYIIVSDPTY